MNWKMKDKQESFKDTQGVAQCWVWSKYRWDSFGFNPDPIPCCPLQSDDFFRRHETVTTMFCMEVEDGLTLFNIDFARIIQMYFLLTKRMFGKGQKAYLHFQIDKMKPESTGFSICLLNGLNSEHSIVSQLIHTVPTLL